MAKTYVSLDLETTGLDPQHDAVIEVGALRFSGSHEIESFSTFVNPGRRIPQFITELTGISDAEVARAPSIRQVAQELRTFVGDDTLVGHNIGFDVAFLRKEKVLSTNPRIDTFSLASILVPHAGRYSLENLVHELGLAFEAQTHRALDDARLAHALFVALEERALQLPQPVLEEISTLGSKVGWAPSSFFQEALYHRARQGFQGGIGAQLAARRGGDAVGPLFVPPVDVDPLEPRNPPLLLDLEALAAYWGPEGALAQAFEAYEVRPQQARMMREVARAFNTGSHLLVEAGTGTGKSLAYLLPALRWADQNDARVVISTNTINLQEQLADKDIPLLERLFPTGFRYMVLKGRSHYLCRRQFQALRRRGPATDDEMMVLAKILLWLPNTLDGDADELFLPTPGERAVWAQLSAATENCDARDCPFYAGEGCFFYRARERAETVHLLIVNHALLLADIAAENRVLPDYEYLIVDEAHHLERATTDALHFSVDWYSLRYAFEELLQPRAGFAGLLGELQGLAHHLPREARSVLATTALQLGESAEQVLYRLELLFEALAHFLGAHATSNNDGYALRLRVTKSLRSQAEWDEVEIAWDAVAAPFESLVKGLAKMVSALEDLSAVELPAVESPRSRLLAVTQRLAETQVQLQAFIAQPQQNAVYWLESASSEGSYNGPKDAVAFHSAPLEVGPLVKEHLFEKKKTVVLTSATLRVGGTFDYIRQRLNAWDAAELAVGSPFDYATAALLYVARDLPDPGSAGYQRAISEAMVALFEATEGRALALFTSYSQLRATAQAITGPLARAGITVYAQGTGISRAQLLSNFRKGERSVLLGTRSFWEGVDLPGEVLSCLAIARLPFDVPDDPLVQARSEICDNPFNDYMVPEAVLRFLQGFGRLIRTRTDRGVVAVLDGRLVSKRYGARFLDSLPGPAVRVGPAAQLPENARRWLAGEPLPPVDAGAGDEPWSVPPPEEPPW